MELYRLRNCTRYDVDKELVFIYIAFHLHVYCFLIAFDENGTFVTLDKGINPDNRLAPIACGHFRIILKRKFILNIYILLLTF